MDLGKREGQVGNILYSSSDWYSSSESLGPESRPPENDFRFRDGNELDEALVDVSASEDVEVGEGVIFFRRFRSFSLRFNRTPKNDKCLVRSVEARRPGNSFVE